MIHFRRFFLFCFFARPLDSEEADAPFILNRRSLLTAGASEAPAVSELLSTDTASDVLLSRDNSFIDTSSSFQSVVRHGTSLHAGIV
jgi:hypothetical protein